MVEQSQAQDGGAEPGTKAPGGSREPKNTPERQTVQALKARTKCKDCEAGDPQCQAPSAETFAKAKMKIGLALM